MKPENIRIISGYGGRVECKVTIDNVIHILEISEVEKLIAEAINRGYQTTLAPRQQYRRIVLDVPAGYVLDGKGIKKYNYKDFAGRG